MRRLYGGVFRNKKVLDNVVPKFYAYCKISGLDNMQLLRRSSKIVHDIGHSTWWRWQRVDKAKLRGGRGPIRQRAEVVEGGHG